RDAPQLQPFPTRRSSDLTFTSPTGDRTPSLKCPLPLASRLPSRLKATLKTSPVCPLRVRASRPLVESQTFTVPSLLALARRLPRSEEHTSELQSLAYLVC